MAEIIVIGAGFSGLAAAAHLADKGHQVKVLEKHNQPGGRARVWEEKGYRFDMGPSWYWMPDLFERFFAGFGYNVSDFYELTRLDPSYRVVWPGGDGWDIPAGLDRLRSFFEAHQPGAASALDRFIDETGYIYRAAYDDYLFRPSLSFFEFVDPRLLKEVFRLRMLRSMAAYGRSFFDHPRLARLVEWPVLFLGASAKETSAMYSLMSYADMALGTWYPMGGMSQIIGAMEAVGRRLGVEYSYGQPVEEIMVENKQVIGVRSEEAMHRCDAVIASADYHYVETQLLPARHRQYDDTYWQSRVMSPSSLLFYLGVDAELNGLCHHTLFFDEDLDRHMDAVYKQPRWPQAPLFYACAPSVTDKTVAPPGKSTLFLLIPLAAGLADSEAQREKLYHQVMARLEAEAGIDIRSFVEIKRSYAMRDFKADYGAFKGNAYGMANTLRQTGPLKPKLKSKTVDGLYFAGQLTVPGPGMPPSLVSGELSANLVDDDF